MYVIYMRASLKFSHSNTAISLNILLVLQILCFRKIFNFRCQHSPYIYNQCIFLLLLMVWYYIYKRQYTDKTLTLRKCMCMRASEASELRKFWYFYILKLLFLSICCWYIRYFVGTNDMLVGLHVPINFQMYRQKSEKALLGANCPPPLPPPPPPLATLMPSRSWCDETIVPWHLHEFGFAHWPA